MWSLLGARCVRHTECPGKAPAGRGYPAGQRTSDKEIRWPPNGSSRGRQSGLSCPPTRRISRPPTPRYVNRDGIRTDLCFVGDFWGVNGVDCGNLYNTPIWVVSQKALQRHLEAPRCVGHIAAVSQVLTPGMECASCSLAASRRPCLSWTGRRPVRFGLVAVDNGHSGEALGIGPVHGERD